MLIPDVDAALFCVAADGQSIVLTLGLSASVVIKPMAVQLRRPPLAVRILSSR